MGWAYTLRHCHMFTPPETTESWKSDGRFEQPPFTRVSPFRQYRACWSCSLLLVQANIQAIQRVDSQNSPRFFEHQRTSKRRKRSGKFQNNRVLLSDLRGNSHLGRSLLSRSCYQSLAAMTLGESCRPSSLIYDQKLSNSLLSLIRTRQF